MSVMLGLLVYIEKSQKHFIFLVKGCENRVDAVMHVAVLCVLDKNVHVMTFFM